MTIRRRLSLTAAVAVAVAVALASAASYVAVRAKLRGEVDSSLHERAETIVQLGVTRREPRRPERPRSGGRPFPGPDVYVQFLRPDGAIRASRHSTSSPPLPVGSQARAVAAGHAQQSSTDAHVRGAHLRLLIVHLPRGGAVELARSLEEIDGVLATLAALLAAITLIGIGVAAALGGLISRAALAPVHRFTERSERLAGAIDLGQRMPVTRDDELGRLARAFNTTLAALERSLAAQRQLVADASHELRTPLASLRTNIEVLQRESALPPRERADLMRDVIEEIDALSVLVTDIVDLARRGEARESFQDVRLDELVAGAVQRARRHAAGVTFEATLEPTLVQGVPERIDRAVANLLDNAAKWSPQGGAVEVTLSGGELVVRDQGPGFAADDLPFVFDRFYRSPAARSTPGSGLGLAIVRQVVEMHGGRVSAANTAGGGAEMRVTFPDAVRLDSDAAGEQRTPAVAADR